MSKWTRIFALAVILVAMGAWDASLAADPDKDDISVVAYQGAPGCEAPEGDFKISNASSEWHYLISVNAAMENDSNGLARCDNYPPQYCNGEKCECDLSDTFAAAPLDDEEPHGGCSYPKCGVTCDSTCDNSPTQCPPNTIDHCNCIHGTYQVTYYSEDGSEWTAMPPAYPTVITQKETNPECPNPPARCD